MNDLSTGPGSLIRLTSWTDNRPTLQIGYKAPKSKVVVAVIVGEDSKKTIGFGPGEAVLALERLGFRSVDDQLLEQAKSALAEYAAADGNTDLGDEMHSVLTKIITSVKDRK